MHACRVWINSTSLWQKSSYVNIYNSLSEKEIESSLIVISVYIQNTQYLIYFAMIASLIDSLCFYSRE